MQHIYIQYLCEIQVTRYYNISQLQFGMPSFHAIQAVSSEESLLQLCLYLKYKEGYMIVEKTVRDFRLNQASIFSLRIYFATIIFNNSFP